VDPRPIRRWLGHHAEGVLAARGDPQRLAAVFAHSAVPMVLSDDERRYIDANQLALDALGLSRDSLQKMRIDDVTPPYLVSELAERWARLLETGVVMGDEVAEERSYVALPWYAVANVLPGRHVVVFMPPSVTADDLPRDSQDAVSGPIGHLTPRELEVLELAANGLNGPGIAERLVLSPTTIRTHLEHIYQKLRVHDRAAAVAKAMRLGLIR
jgi:DNA-binding CsgD family transcriptional regulator